VRVNTLEGFLPDAAPSRRINEKGTSAKKARRLHRYIDLRRPEMQQTIRTRYRVIENDRLPWKIWFWKSKRRFLD